MCRTGSIIVGLLFTSGVGLCADPPRSTAESVRATVKKLWSNKPDEVETAYKQLEADPLALPVLRGLAVSDPDVGHRGVLEKLVEKVAKSRDKVLSERIEQWATDGRLDLLTEVRSLTDGKAAKDAVDHLLKANRRLREVGRELLDARAPQPPPPPGRPPPPPRLGGGLPWADGAAFKKKGPPPLFDAGEAGLPEKDYRHDVALFADRVSAPSMFLTDALVVCRSELTHFATATPNRGRLGRCEWSGCALFANAGVRFSEALGCVLVVDGDLELLPQAQVLGSVVVVNGGVTDAGKPWSWLTQSVVWAAGDINLAPGKTTEMVFLAGGKIIGADKLAAKGCAEENLTEPPLPVRFLDPAADYGLTLEATKDGMKVSKVADKSAFAEFLKAGDVIAAVTGVKTPTAQAFRHELRRGILEGAVLLEVARDKEKLELLVPVPDVPPAPKKEKKDDKDPKAKPVEK